MKQLTKKMLSLLIAVTMLLTMATAITVGAETSEVVVFSDDFTTFDSKLYSLTSAITSTYGASMEHKDGALYFSFSTAGDSSNVDIVRFNFGSQESFPYVKGGTYTVSMDIKVQGISSRLRFRVGSSEPYVTSQDFGTVTGYENFSGTFQFEVDTSMINSFVQLRRNLKAGGTGSVSADSEMWIDNIKITQSGVPRITLANGANGTAVLTGDGVVDAVDDNGYFISPGTDATLTVTADEGYDAVVTKNGVPVVVPDGGVITLEDVTDDTDLVVSYVEKSSVALGLEDTTAWFKPVGGVDTIYVYSKISEYTTGESGFNYGIVINNANWSEPITLKALEVGSTADNQIPCVVAPGQAFAIKVYGGAIDKKYGSYLVAPFAGGVSVEDITLEYTVES